MILMILTFVENLRVADLEHPPAVSRVTVGQYRPVAHTVQVSGTSTDQRCECSAMTISSFILIRIKNNNRDWFDQNKAFVFKLFFLSFISFTLLLH